VAQALWALAEAHCQQDPSFRTTLPYTRAPIRAIYQQGENPCLGLEPFETMGNLLTENQFTWVDKPVLSLSKGVAHPPLLNLPMFYSAMTNFASYIFTPGPVKIPQYILEIGAMQAPYFRNASFSAVLLECERLLLELAGAAAGSRVVFLAASGTGAMEAAVINLLSPGDKAFIVNGGGFGQRFADICNCHGIPSHEHKAVDTNLADIDALGGYASCSALLVNGHETTTGVMYDLHAIGRYCMKNKLLNIVDAISLFVTDHIDMREQNIDALIVSSHKGLALPPGMSMVILGPKAIEKIGKANSIYFNFHDYLSDGLRGQTPFTPAVTILLQLHARLKRIAHDGLEHEIAKARQIAAYFRSSVNAWPLQFYSRFMPNAMTALSPTDGASALGVVNDLAERYRVIVAPNGGALKDKVFRVAHMGDMTQDYVDVLIGALDRHYGVVR
jgi:aspartate aminotransferase-like enzyme